jgi:hypothetical protein
VKRLADVETARPSLPPGLSIVRAPYMSCGAHDAVWAIVGLRTARSRLTPSLRPARRYLRRRA